ncbi:DNA polymerase family B-domain-containing protein [Hyaloraphidium curvatum]|nr:DNA polymerase family B-domain-containing protein [Hyaloraphidium curvatum]
MENVSAAGNAAELAARGKRAVTDGDWLASDGSAPSGSQSAPAGSQSAAAKKRRTGGAPKASDFEVSLETDERDVDNAAMEQAWERPAVAIRSPRDGPLIFQQIELDDYVGDVHEIVAQDIGHLRSAPIVRLFGVTEVGRLPAQLVVPSSHGAQGGNSVLCHVHGFFPYFYIPSPNGFQLQHLDDFQRALENAMRMDQNKIHVGVIKTELVMKSSIMNYHGNQRFAFIKITVAQPKYVAVAKRLLEGGMTIPGFGPSGQRTTFESNISFDMRFMIDFGIVGANWIELPAGKYMIRRKDQQTGNAQLEVDIFADDLISHPADGEWSKIAPLRVMSFDIECAGRKGVFPEPEIDPVIQIASVVQIQGETKPFVRAVFTLNTCANIVGATIRSFSNERDMLHAWSEFFAKIDPDIVTGYNVNNFDWPYLLDRAKALKADRFPFLGRLRNARTEAKDQRFSSKAYGTRDNKAINLDGRIQLDVLHIMLRDYKLRSYTLNSVCAHFLGEQKEDVHHSIITDLQNGNEETRRRLAVYCLKDAWLPLRLLDKLMCVINYMEMARVTGVPVNFLLTRGQQIKVISQLFRKALEENLVVPAIHSEGGDGEQYEGATVIEPERGYYDVPIATLDFNSLYPSIMMAHNLCYTTLLTSDLIAKYKLEPEVDFVKTPSGDFFVKAERRKGLLPTILNDLLAARKRAKADLKKETDPFKRAVLDGRQLALKVSANSVYGFTGATNGKLPCLQISSSVTAYGRDMIASTKELVEKQFTTANGYAYDAKVIYGDTDSVMVKFGMQDMAEVMRLGREAAEFVTKTFIKPINLEFEKAYFPYLLINKKRYAGLYWTKPEKFDKMDAKGIETVRRDNCLMVQNVLDTCLRKILMDRDVTGAIDYAKQTIADLLQNKIDMSQLVITKALSKADYAAKQPHVELAERMRKRDPGSAPNLGDRVAYVLIKGHKDSRAYENSEDPIYVLEHNLPIDTKYYLENQLSGPLTRLFEPILGDKTQSLFTGDHTRVIQVSAPSVGGLAKFAIRTAVCMGCKTPLGKNESAVCKHCEPKTGELYQKHLDTFTELESKFARLWTQCQRCQGSLHQDVICTSKDCPIFYMRSKARKELEQAATTLERFDYHW